MGFFSDLMGKTSAKSAEALGQRSMGRINEGYDSRDRYATTGYNTATGRLTPFMNQATTGYNLLADSYGLNGDAARNKAFQNYSSDPFNAHSGQVTNNLLRNIMNTSAGRGMGNSGAAALAMGRAGLESQDRRIADWRGGIGQFANQAIPLAGTLAGMDTAYYGGMGDSAIGRASALNATDANATMAANNARMQGVNNLLGIGGTLASLATTAMTGMPVGSFGGQRGGSSPGGVPVGGTWSPPNGYSADRWNITTTHR